MPVTLDILFLGELRALGEPGSCPCLWSTPSQGWSGSWETVAMAGSLPLSLSWLDPQACLRPAGFLICTRSLHEQHLDSEPLAKHSRFFGYRDFVKGPGAFPGLFMAHADSYSCWNFTYSQKYFPSILGGGLCVCPRLAHSLGIFGQTSLTLRHMERPPTTGCPSSVSWMLKG